MVKKSSGLMTNVVRPLKSSEVKYVKVSIHMASCIVTRLAMCTVSRVRVRVRLRVS